MEKFPHTGSLLVVLVSLLAPAARAQDAVPATEGSKTVIGSQNPDIREGAQQLLQGNGPSGVELTLRGLKVAQGSREKEAALSNLCAGYIMLRQYDVALGYCNQLLAQNDKNWRAYNNRAIVYLKTGKFDQAHNDLLKGEALNPGAHTLRIVRSMYLDAVEPVEVESGAPQAEREDESTEE